MYRTVRPPEVLTLTDSWGVLHPWPQEARDDCTHPFVVADALAQDSYDAIVDDARKNPPKHPDHWGSLAPGWEHVDLVEFHIFDLVVIGAELGTMKEARDFSSKMRHWALTSTGGTRGAAGVYCAHAIAPKPFTPR